MTLSRNAAPFVGPTVGMKKTLNLHIVVGRGEITTTTPKPPKT